MPQSVDARDWQGWGERADRAVERFVEFADNDDLHADTWMSLALALRRGWGDADAVRLLDDVRARRLPGGGYGLGFAWDAFQDGTTNPPDAAYAITITDHVGLVLLDAFDHGAAPAAEIQGFVDEIVAFRRARPGCLAYSDTGFDDICVHNINTSAAWFLAEAGGRGSPFGMESWTSSSPPAVRLSFTGPWWPYSDLTAMSAHDWDHEATVVENLLTLDPELGREALRAIMVPDPTGEMPDVAPGNTHPHRSSRSDAPPAMGLRRVGATSVAR